MEKEQEEYFRKLNLVDSSGAIHDSDRNVILSAVTVDGMNIRITSPIN